MEEWKRVSGFERYEVSDAGRIRNTKTGRTLKPSKDKDGYTYVILQNGRANRAFRYVHRLVLEAFVGPCPTGMEACHFPDHTRSNCRLENLRWDTRKANCLERKPSNDNGRHIPAWRAKLSEDQVREIRLLLASGDLTHKQIGEMFGVSKNTVWHIASGRHWRHVA